METQIVVAGYVIHDGKVLLIHHRKLDLWLPPGGHIEPNEIPDDAVIREIKEETGLDVEILNQSSLPMEGNIRRSLAVPFAVNVHNVGDHDHCCLFYLCKPKNPEQLKINEELKGAAWFSKEDLDKPHVTIDVKHLALKAFEALRKSH
ncbi:NUDIX domain-containing protein [Candidatus Woesearchaeota archaeon]|nr:NUDIX domain-containing protein [Candidatus Woesearchaeota archaeon]